MLTATFDNVDIETVKGYKVYTIKDPHSLTQVSGYLRYEARPGRMFFRGQTVLHDHLTPSLFRVGSYGAVTSRSQELNTFTNELAGGHCQCVWYTRKQWYAKSHECDEQLNVRANSSLVSGTYRAAVEPLLQHYGVRTRWVDAVDNIWVALWFACHSQITKDSYAYHLRRSTVNENDAYAYIYLLQTGKLADTVVPGYAIGTRARLVDLRYCVPSVYIRPHAQHGVLLARPRLPVHSGSSDIMGAFSLDDAVAAIIRVSLANALDWLGDGALTNHFTLFPPAVHDVGYRRLLAGPAPAASIGGIVNYQGGM